MILPLGDTPVSPPGTVTAKHMPRSDSRARAKHGYRQVRSRKPQSRV
jgi:hypothetical protein